MNKQLIEWAVAIFIGFAVAFLIRSFVLTLVYVDGTSMEPTFHNGDRAVAEMISYDFHSPHIDDVVVVPQNFQNTERNLIKRVVGLPGDVIEVKNGQLYRNGKAVNEGFIKEKMTTTFPRYTVPKGDVFVMGDNRNNSGDSRIFGPFAIKDIHDRVMFKIP